MSGSEFGHGLDRVAGSYSDSLEHELGVSIDDGQVGPALAGATWFREIRTAGSNCCKSGEILREPFKSRLRSSLEAGLPSAIT